MQPWRRALIAINLAKWVKKIVAISKYLHMTKYPLMKSHSSAE
jgi:hypothetical protein